jgi:hypothetical protein
VSIHRPNQDKLPNNNGGKIGTPDDTKHGSTKKKVEGFIWTGKAPQKQVPFKPGWA